LTKLVADKLGANDEHSIPPLVWTSLLLMLLLGGLGGLITQAISPMLVHTGLKIPALLQGEALRSFSLLALSIPVVTITSGLRGILEAQQRFRALNLIRIPMSIFSFAGPLLVLPFSHSLVPVIAVLVAGRLAGLAAYLGACFYAMPALRHNFALDRSTIMPVMKFGGWMTVSNVISPMMAYLDRFLIGALLSVGAVAYYTAPFDMVTRLTIISGALVGVLFPAFALSFIQDPGRAGVLLSRSMKYVFLAIFPIALVIVTLAPEGLRLWLGPAFAQNSSGVLRWLAAGVFINSLAQIPFALIQGAGRPDITAKLHFIELPAYLAAVWYLTRRLGIEGTAIAWTARVAVDAMLLLLFSLRLIPHRPGLLPKLATAVAGGVLALFGAALPATLAMKATYVLAALFAFGLAGWYWGLGTGERVFLLSIRKKMPIKVQAN
jgi:O-antigen/teichoic acid export membrane protein